MLFLSTKLKNNNQLKLLNVSLLLNANYATRFQWEKINIAGLRELLNSITDSIQD